MNLDFITLKLSGFKSFSKTQTLDISGFAPGLHFLRGRNESEPFLGSNGAGKSTLWDALTWCLYGRTLDGLRNTDIKPWQGPSKTQVEVTIKCDGKRYTITRTANPNMLIINSEAVDNPAVEKLIGISFEVFRHTILLGQGQPLFFDLPPRDKLQILSDTLKLDRWEQLSAKAAKVTREWEDQLIITDSEISSNKASQKDLEELIHRARAAATEWTESAAKQLAQDNVKLTELRRQLEPAQRALDEAKLKADSSGLEYDACRKEVDKLKNLMLTASDNFHKVEVELHHSRLEAKRLQEEAAQLLAKVCPTCGQPLKDSTIASKHHIDLKKRMEALGLRSLELKHIKLGNICEGIKGKLDAQTQYAKQFGQRYDAAQQTVEFQGPQVAELTTKIKMIEASQGAKKEEINPHREMLQTLRKKFNALTDALDELELDRKKLLRVIERTGFWVKGFKDVRLYIVDEILQELELATNALLPESGLREWQVSYAIEKETKSGSVSRGLNVKVLSPTNKEAVRWESWSGGEGQRLRLVGALALSEVLLRHAGVQCSLEVLDEPSAHLSPEGVHDLCEFLGERAHDLGKIGFYIDHTAREGVQFSSTLTVVKTDEGSKLRFRS